MIQEGLLAVSLFDILGRGILANPEQGVVIV
jgi:hypothetical protein